MGTSTSSKGPGSNVPLVPPWVPQVPPLPDAPGAPEPGNVPAPETPPPVAPVDAPGTDSADQPPPMVAPPRRFASARNHLSRFAQSGDQQSLGSGLRHYTGKGLGGARQAAQRMGGTAQTAGKLYGALSALRTQAADAADIGLELATLRGRPVREICDRIVEAVRPPDGTLDAEASRQSIGDALSELMALYPNADLMDLGQEQIEMVIERYLAYDTCRRVELDVGQTVYRAAPSVAEGVRRMEEMKAYVREKVYACFRALRQRGRQLTKAIATSFAARVIQDTFTVFEEFV